MTYVPSAGVNTSNQQATQRDEVAQSYQAQYLPLLVGGSAEDTVVDHLNAAIQNFYLAGAIDAANALVQQAVAAANAIGATAAATVFSGSIQKVLDSLNPPQAPPEQQAIVATSLLVEIGDLQAQLAASQALSAQLAESISAKTQDLGANIPQVGG